MTQKGLKRLRHTELFYEKIKLLTLKTYTIKDTNMDGICQCKYRCSGEQIALYPRNGSQPELERVNGNSEVVVQKSRIDYSKGS